MINKKTFLEILADYKTWNTCGFDTANVLTDSRELKGGEVFVCLKGEKYDAFNFMDEVLKKNVKAFVFQGGETQDREAQIEKISRLYPECFFVQVEDSLLFLQNLAHAHRVAWGQERKHVIGLTGSNGKTTTKEILHLLLEPILGERLHCTMGNYNNHIGVPLTLLGLKEQHEVAIVEMGTNHTGEIARLCEISCPTSGLITNIGAAHIEHFLSPQNIFREKKALYSSVMSHQQKGFFVINTDDNFLKTLDHEDKAHTFGEAAKYFQAQCENSELVFIFAGEKTLIKNPSLFGVHLYHNLGLSLSLCILLFPEHKERFISLARELALPQNNRGEWKQYDQYDVYLDAYNANPSSMVVSLNTFMEFQKQKGRSADELLFVLGDMNELGDLSCDFHREIGEHLASIGATKAHFIGKFAKDYAKGFGEERSKVYEDKEALKNELINEKSNFKAFYLKASRSLQLESLTAIF